MSDSTHPKNDTFVRRSSLTDWLMLFTVVAGVAGTHLITIRDLYSKQVAIETRVERIDMRGTQYLQAQSFDNANSIGLVSERVSVLERADADRLKAAEVREIVQDAISPLKDRITDFIDRSEATDSLQWDNITDLRSKVSGEA